MFSLPTQSNPIHWLLLQCLIFLFGCGGSHSSIHTTENPASAVPAYYPIHVGIDPVPALPFPQLKIDAESVAEEAIDDELKSLAGAKGYRLGTGATTDYIVEIPAAAPESTLPPLVLVHGLGDAGMRDFYPVVSALSQNRNLLLIDLPGLARSTAAEDQPLTPIYFARRVAAIIQARIDGPFDLLGHSLGGNVCLTLSAQPGLRLRRLVIVDAAGVLNRYAFIDSLVDTAATSTEKASTAPGRVFRQLASNVTELTNAMEPSEKSLTQIGNGLQKPGARAAFALILHRVGPSIAGISAPTLVIWGNKDKIAPLRTGQLLADRIRNAKLVTLDGVGHVPMKESTKLFNRYVTDFLDFPAGGIFSKDAQPTAQLPVPQHHIIDCSQSGIRHLTGRFRSLQILGCPELTIENATIDNLIIKDSAVALTRVQIENGLAATDSKLSITGGRISGDIGMELDDVSADIAGTLVTGRHYAIATRRSAYLLLSVTFIDSPHHSGVLHTRMALETDEAL